MASDQLPNKQVTARGGERFTADYIRQQPEYRYLVHKDRPQLIHTCVEDGQVKLKLGHDPDPPHENAVRLPEGRKLSSQSAKSGRSRFLSHTTAYFLTSTQQSARKPSRKMSDQTPSGTVRTLSDQAPGSSVLGINVKVERPTPLQVSNEPTQSFEEENSAFQRLVSVLVPTSGQRSDGEPRPVSTNSQPAFRHQPEVMPKMTEDGGLPHAYRPKMTDSNLRQQLGELGMENSPKPSLVNSGESHTRPVIQKNANSVLECPSSGVPEAKDTPNGENLDKTHQIHSHDVADKRNKAGQNTGEVTCTGNERESDECASREESSANGFHKQHDAAGQSNVIYRRVTRPTTSPDSIRKSVDTFEQTTPPTSVSITDLKDGHEHTDTDRYRPVITSGQPSSSREQSKRAFGFNKTTTSPQNSTRSPRKGTVSQKSPSPTRILTSRVQLSSENGTVRKAGKVSTKTSGARKRNKPVLTASQDGTVDRTQSTLELTYTQTNSETQKAASPDAASTTANGFIVTVVDRSTANHNAQEYNDSEDSVSGTVKSKLEVYVGTTEELSGPVSGISSHVAPLDLSFCGRSFTPVDSDDTSGDEEVDGDSVTGFPTHITRVDVKDNKQKPGESITGHASVSAIADVFIIPQIIVDEASTASELSDFSEDSDAYELDADEYLQFVQHTQQDGNQYLVLPDSDDPLSLLRQSRMTKQGRHHNQTLLHATNEPMVCDKSEERTPDEGGPKRRRKLGLAIDLSTSRYSMPAPLESAGLRTALATSTYNVEFNSYATSLRHDAVRGPSSLSATRKESTSSSLRPTSQPTSRRSSLRSTVATTGRRDSQSAGPSGEQIIAHQRGRQVSWTGKAPTSSAIGRRHSSVLSHGTSFEKRLAVAAEINAIMHQHVPNKKTSYAASYQGEVDDHPGGRRLSVASSVSATHSRRVSRVESTTSDLEHNHYHLQRQNTQYDPTFEKSEKFNHQRENAFNKASQYLTPVRSGLRNVQVHYTKTTANYNDGLIYAHLLRAAHIKNAAVEDGVYELERRLYTRRHGDSPHATTFYDVQGSAKNPARRASTASKGYRTVAKKKRERSERIHRKNDEIEKGYTPRALSLKQLGPEDIDVLRRQCRYLRVSPDLQQHLYDLDIGFDAVMSTS